jgi:hypothetical protein
VTDGRPILTFSAAGDWTNRTDKTHDKKIDRGLRPLGSVMMSP